MEKIEGKCFGEERALYGGRSLWVYGCAFEGEEDGESALKEAADILAQDCRFDLRYPFWHNRNTTVQNCDMTDGCRAPFWYCEDLSVSDTRLHGTKAVRECRGVRLTGCDICSEEFGWFSSDVHICKSRAQGVYFLLGCRDVSLSDVEFSGKYSFQYLTDATVENCVLDTKDAFWHAKNVTVKNCTLRGEYLAWYSENLTLINCKIEGTQPLCYCKGLRLIDCEMKDTDLAFEKSEVEARVLSHVLSIKNPLRGRIEVESVGEIIMDDGDACGEIVCVNG